MHAADGERLQCTKGLRRRTTAVPCTHILRRSALSASNFPLTPPLCPQNHPGDVLTTCRDQARGQAGGEFRRVLKRFLARLCSPGSAQEVAHSSPDHSIVSAPRAIAAGLERSSVEGRAAQHDEAAAQVLEREVGVVETAAQAQVAVAGLQEVDESVHSVEASATPRTVELMWSPATSEAGRAAFMS
eukprot:Tamp_11641.p1 GENE.Tamp_11641~~Tamp_11641.p1  ORF type:complete len:187 (-),score=13.34 Tamp_11641:881-1441(-)